MLAALRNSKKKGRMTYSITGGVSRPIVEGRLNTNRQLILIC